MLRGESTPWLDPAALVRLHARGEHAVIIRLLATAKLHERCGAFGHWLRHAGALLGGNPRYTAAALHARMKALARRSKAALEVSPIDPATVEGACLAALLANQWECPHRTTIVRAWKRR